MRRIGICGVIVCALTLALPALAQEGEDGNIAKIVFGRAKPGMEQQLEDGRASPPAQQPVSRVVINLPQGQTFWPDLSISPDGNQVAYIARTGSGADSLQLYVRRLNELESRPIPGTAGAFHAAFSPDGKWLAFGGLDGLLKQGVGFRGSAPDPMRIQRNNRWGVSRSKLDAERGRYHFRRRRSVPSFGRRGYP